MDLPINYRGKMYFLGDSQIKFWWGGNEIANFKSFGVEFQNCSSLKITFLGQNIPQKKRNKYYLAYKSLVKSFRMTRKYIFPFLEFDLGAEIPGCLNADTGHLLPWHPTEINRFSGCVVASVYQLLCVILGKHSAECWRLQSCWVSVIKARSRDKSCDS